MSTVVQNDARVHGPYVPRFKRKPLYEEKPTKILYTLIVITVRGVCGLCRKAKQMHWSVECCSTDPLCDDLDRPLLFGVAMLTTIDHRRSTSATSGQSNLTTARIAAAYEQFSGIRHVAPV